MTRPAGDVLSPRELAVVTDLAYRTCGIDIRKGKAELIQARVGKQIRQGKFSSFKQFYEHVVTDTTGEELIALVDSLTTNFTSFLREPDHFDFLRKTIVRAPRDEVPAHPIHPLLRRRRRTAAAAPSGGCRGG